ncbi:MAG: SDR family NAD(P)-dependent oxidoreductase [Carbonactinosporaceae bacterium]
MTLPPTPHNLPDHVSRQLSPRRGADGDFAGRQGGLVTGAGPNIGSGIALLLSRYGAKVACNDIQPDAATACIRRIERHGGSAMAIPGDVSDEAGVKGYIKQVLDIWGKIDILINNAALLGGRGGGRSTR